MEGDDDKHVVEHLTRCHPDMPIFETKARGGIEHVLNAIVPELKAPGRIALGIVVDANDDPKKRWQSICKHLRREGIRAPRTPRKGGAVLHGAPRIGIWLMPDNQKEGELEDFVKELIPANDPVWKMACQFIDNIPESERKFSAHKTTKASVRAWLATRKKPRHLGEAIGAGDLPVGVPVAISFADWLKRVFGA